MTKRNIIVFILFIVLLGGVILEQNYIDSSYVLMEKEINVLNQNLEDENISLSKQKIKQIDSFWKNREVVLSLFADFRDIEQIGKQINLISSHLENKDFDLAKVEAKLLEHIILTYHNTVSFDWQNII